MVQADETDHDCSGRPRSPCSEVNIAPINQLMQEDRLITVEVIAESLKISVESAKLVFQIKTKINN